MKIHSHVFLQEKRVSLKCSAILGDFFMKSDSITIQDKRTNFRMVEVKSENIQEESEKILSLFQPKNNLCWRIVSLTMSGQTLLMFKRFVAIIALEILLFIVGHFVALQFTRWSKTVRALVTFVWLFSSVCTPHVYRHLASSGAWKVTLWTFLRLFSRVGHLVQPHSCQCIWRIFTLVALVRLHPSVRHNVSF